MTHPLHSPAALLKPSSLQKPHEGMPLDCLTLVAKKTGIPELHRTITIGKTIVGSPPPPGNCADSKLKHNSSLPIQKAYLLSLELQPQGQAEGFPNIWRLRRHYQGDTILAHPSALLQHGENSQKGNYTLI